MDALPLDEGRDALIGVAYFGAASEQQFDAVVHLGHTRALEPIEHTQEWVEGELAETLSTGL